MNLFINTVHAGVITDAPSISKVGINILYFLLSVAGIIAILALVLAGIFYLTAQGDEKKTMFAKKATTYAVFGIILAMSGMIVINLIGQFFKT